MKSRYLTEWDKFLWNCLRICRCKYFVIKSIDVVVPYKLCLVCYKEIPLSNVFTETEKVFLEVGRKQSFKLAMDKYLAKLETLIER